MKKITKVTKVTKVTFVTIRNVNFARSSIGFFRKKSAKVIFFHILKTLIYSVLRLSEC